MSNYTKDEIRAGLFMTLDAPVDIAPAKANPTLVGLVERLESVRKKLAIVRQFVEQNRR